MTQDDQLVVAERTSLGQDLEAELVCSQVVVTLCARRPGTRVVLVTVHDDPELAGRGYAAGALAFVSKHRAGDELVPAVRGALRGDRYVATSD